MRRIVLFAAVPLLAGLAAREGAPQDSSAERSGWNPESAARYLDKRMDAWFAGSKKLQTGDGETSCVSCHTSVPYALSRSVLRRAMRVIRPTPQETRLIDETARRVETYDGHQLLYDFNDGKKTESRGTEAVLNALILARADAEQNRREATERTRKAFGRLWETQRSSGAWDWLDFGLEPFESIDAAYHGATLAALAIGSAPAISSNPAGDAKTGIEKLRRYLREQYATQSLFNRTWLLLASARLKGLMTRAQQKALIAEIQNRQREDGGWSLETLGPWRWSKSSPPFQPPGAVDASLLAKSDGYATGLNVYALREAGLRVEHPAVSGGVRWLKANQHSPQDVRTVIPGWRAHSLNFDRENGGEKGEPWRRMFMSDAATALAVMALVGADETDRRPGRR